MTCIYSVHTSKHANAKDNDILLGGEDGFGAMDLAAKFGSNGWERVGSLMQRRLGHRSLVQGSKVLHIGGGDEE